MSNSHSYIITNIDWMKKRHVDLLEELRQLDADLSLEERKLADLLSTISSLECKKATITKKAQAIRKEEPPILG